MIPKYLALLDKEIRTPFGIGQLKMDTLYRLVNSINSVLQGFALKPHDEYRSAVSFKIWYDAMLP